MFSVDTTLTIINILLIILPLICRELQDLKHGQLLMQHLVERQGVPVFNSIPVALSCTSKVRLTLGIVFPLYL